MLNKNKKQPLEIHALYIEKLKDCLEIISLQKIPTREHLGGTNDSV